MGPDTVPATMESVYRAWDEAIAAGDVSSLVSLYAADAEIESPLIYEFTKGERPSPKGEGLRNTAQAGCESALGPT